MNVRGSTEIYGVIGFPVKHSLSPVFQNAAFSYLGIDAVYVPFEIAPEDLEEALKGLKKVGIKGLNVTVPHKEKVLSLADSLSEEVKEIGAANTLKFTLEGIEAYNTDWVGFLRAIEELRDPRGKRVLVLGAGGASRAVLYALKRVGARIYLWNRTKEKALRLSEEFEGEVVDSVEEVLDKVEVIVNTTSVGLKPEDKPLFDYSRIESSHIVVDLIYKETPLIKVAREKGCLYQNGFPMLVYQGAESFKIWTGCEAPVKIMKLALKDYGYVTNLTRTPQRT